MSNYFLMETDNFLDYGITENPKINDDQSFLSGNVIDETQLPALEFETNFPSKKKIPHFLGDVIPLMSKELIECLQKAGIDSFQTFPVQLTNPETGQKFDNYFAFNVIGIIKAVNMNESDFDILMEGDKETPPLLAFREIVLNKNKINDALIFRVVESPDSLLIHKSVVDCLVSNRPKNGWGVISTEVEVI
ncbi:imm11 family protein [Flavobacterium sp. HNIBRBA15423]|uniref:imm11 family protein n=1 Tax=Flavobacterium sp. HNIBRBA15423 TaxID=3458683 RepID=UPI0040444137